ncbi:MAG: histidine phosphatase family protein [Gammaproteobacteria bacterium]|nr:histidine phosphatase family protein [Gammaproteobacteria bacterium]
MKRGGHVVLMRHATAEQAGDPLAFAINDCGVQRNLSQEGRREAELIGRAFRAWSVPVAKVLSSRYCRTQETAKLAFSRVTTWQPLDLLYALPEQDRGARTEVVTERIGAYAGNGNLIMITHRPNIDALTFEIVEPGGLLVLESDHEGSFNIVGHLSPDDLEVK